MRRSTLLLALTIAAATPSMAQQNVLIEVVVGTALVESSEGLVPADANTVLRAGDHVYLKSGSAALLSNVDNGCFVSLRYAGEYVVPQLENCISGQANVASSNFVVKPTNGEAVLVEGYSTGSVAPVVAGLGFVAVTAAAVAYSTAVMNDSDPVAVSLP